jgi:hypothetical protein
MPITIRDNKKKALVNIINQRFDEYLARFPFSKYPTEPLEQWHIQFSGPSTVGAETLRSAMYWRCGFWQRKDAPYAHKQATIVPSRLGQHSSR